MPVRLDRDIRDRIEIAATRMRTPRSAIIRMAILNTLGEIEGGYIRFSRPPSRCGIEEKCAGVAGGMREGGRTR